MLIKLKKSTLPIRTTELFFLRIAVDFSGKRSLREARLLSPFPE